MMMDHIRRRARRFLTSQDAGITVEMVMVTPLLLWGYLGMFVLFEGYRNISANIGASYTIADLLSRQKSAVDMTMINGLNEIQDILVQSPEKTALRVSVITYNAALDETQLVWSEATDGQPDITDATLNSELMPYVPPMYDGEQLIVVETWMAFVPFLDISLSDLLTGYTDHNDYIVFGPFYFESISVTRPRFSPQLCFETCGTGNPGGSTSDGANS